MTAEKNDGGEAVAPQSPRHQALAMLAGASGSHSKFLETVVRALALGLDCRIAAVGEANADKTKVQLLVILKDGVLVDPYTYDLAGTPCEGIYSSTDIQPNVHHCENLCDLFPEDSALVDIGAESYRAEAIQDAEGNRIGHVFVIDDKPMLDSADDTAFFRLIGQRVGAEINRWRADAMQKEQRHLLQTVVDNLPIPVNLSDTDGSYLLINKLFETWYGKSSDQVIGRTAEQVFDISAEALQIRLAEEAEVLRNGEASSREEMKTLADGSQRYVIVTKFPVRDSSGAITGFGSTSTDITDRKRAEEDIHHLAMSDPLTGLANRNSFVSHLEEAVSMAKRTGKAIALMMLDLDKFKPVNDTYGHVVGDALLKEVSGKMKAVCRETDIVARLGGDEFAIILTTLDKPDDVKIPADRIVEDIGAATSIDGHTVKIGVSIGISFYPTDAADPDQMIRNSDLALYRAKAEGRGKSCTYDKTLDN